MNNPFVAAEAPQPELHKNAPSPAPERAKEPSQKRGLLLQALEAYEDDPKAALELLAAQKDSAEEEGLEAIRGALLQKVYARLNRLETKLETSAATSPDAVREDLVHLMQELEALSRVQPAGVLGWDSVVRRYQRVLSIKKGSSVDVSRIFSEIFDEFNDFIEDELVSMAIREISKEHGSANIAQAMDIVYGRSKEEVEELKRRNRERTVELMEELNEKPYISFEDIRQLHETNNRGIVPKTFSRMREAKTEEHLDEHVGFGLRVGTFPEDLPEEMIHFEARAADLIDKAVVSNMSDTQYEIGIAQLHNDLLDMHPFADRNGSTALLFIELMKVRRGYKPPKTRERVYYIALGKALGYNPVALSIVGYEQYKIGYRYGYFEGEVVKTKKKKYDLAITIIKRLKEKKKPKQASPQPAEAV